ncbi:RHS repeat-associated core domain-containing protein, partial [Streptomyces sp. NPDC029044]
MPGLALGMGLAMLPGLLSPVAFAADRDDPLGRPTLKKARSADVSPLTAKANRKATRTVAEGEAADAAAARRARTDQNRSVTWPGKGTAQLTLPDKGAAKAKPGSLPLTLGPASGKKRTADSVQVNVLDQKAARALGVKGVVLTVTGPKTGGRAELGVDYSAFASAYGADWAGRLQMQRLPGCALSDPSKAKCRTRLPLESTNKRGADELSAPLAFAPAARSASTGSTMVLALAAGSQSGAGDLGATPLAASSTWEAGGSSGTFTWSYPLRTP